MGKPYLSCLVTITVSFSVYGSCVACSQDSNDNVEGILGRNINLTCNSKNWCYSIKWDKLTTSGLPLIPSEQPVRVGLRESYLPIYGIRFDDHGRYRCYCPGNPPTFICQVYLRTVCQATVILYGRMIAISSNSTSTNFVNVTVGEMISIACSKDVIPETNCSNLLLQGTEPYELPHTFEVSLEYNSCYIECPVREDDRSCNANFTLKVTMPETPTQLSSTSSRSSTVSAQPSGDGNAVTATSSSNITPALTAVPAAPGQPTGNKSTFTTIPDNKPITETTYTVFQQTGKNISVPEKSGLFPVMLFVVIPIVVFVGILVIIFFFIYFSRSNSTFRHKKTEPPVNGSNDTNIPIGPTYASVSKSSPGCPKSDDGSERDIPCTDDAYAEVNSDIKEASPSQANIVKAETSITKDYYSVVNTSNSELKSTVNGNTCDSALYSEVNKGVKQAEKKVDASPPESSGCYASVPDVQSYDVLKQPESSEYDAVGVVSTSPALYAVVDKERKKE